LWDHTQCYSLCRCQKSGCSEETGLLEMPRVFFFYQYIWIWCMFGAGTNCRVIVSYVQPLQSSVLSVCFYVIWKIWICMICDSTVASPSWNKSDSIAAAAVYLMVQNNLELTSLLWPKRIATHQLMCPSRWCQKLEI
jgi:hypothetical protein